MILFLVAAAWADGTPSDDKIGLQATVLAGARSAPESALQVPGEWEGELEPSAMSAVEIRSMPLGVSRVTASSPQRILRKASLRPLSSKSVPGRRGLATFD